MDKAATPLENRVRRRFARGVVTYGLLDEGDRILIALSGGKDSLAMTELLSARARILKPRISLVAAYVAMTNIPYRSDVDYLRAFTTSMGVPFVTCEASFNAATDTRKSPCFLCSWNRRKALFTLAKEHGCNKIALGHNMDDILETLLMNLTFQGAFAAMPPRLQMQKFDMTIIRPLCLEHEADMEAFARQRGYRLQSVRCPYEDLSHRSRSKELLQRMEQMNPHARYSLWSGMNNVQTDSLPCPLPRKAR
ncbi:MAG: tRNA 2-thiocytidine biosynthesis TtcA family protein [Prevotellaceae bacterium]|nr:tRNA 2-thiocytidine biosynthesis TtcA family protein [Prevotellaceae bacterium]